MCIGRASGLLSTMRGVDIPSAFSQYAMGRVQAVSPWANKGEEDKGLRYKVQRWRRLCFLDAALLDRHMVRAVPTSLAPTWGTSDMVHK